MLMTPKERVLTAAARQIPDHVPINYSCNKGIDTRLKKHFNVKDDEGLLKALNVDFRSCNVAYTGPKLHTDVPGRSINVWGVHTRWVEHESGGYWDYCDFPLKDATLEQAQVWPMPSPAHFDYTPVAEICKRWQQYCIVVGHAGLGDTINSTGMIRTMEQVLVDLVTDDPIGLCYIDRKLNVMLEVASRTLEAAKGAVNALWLGEDLGSQNGPLISLDLFRKHLRPRLQKFVDLAKSWNIPVFIHSCGSSSWAFNDFIEMGISVVDTLQPEAKDMAPAYLKKRYGGKLAFHGMISTAGPVAYGKPDDVTKNIRQTLDVMMPGGGYMFAPTHQLQDNSPTENVVAMYDAAVKFGKY